MSIHVIAQTGFGQGTNDLYDRARPSYQPFALDYIWEAIKGTPIVNVVEIGAGTGIFTRALLAHTDLAANLKEFKAFEPSEGMREVFIRTVADERVTIADGTFDNVGVEDHWADLIVIAQAFHWCLDYDKAYAEFARILKPKGTVALIWNLEDRDRARWVASLRGRIERHESNTPQFRLNLWRKGFDTASYKNFFELPVEKAWPYILSTTVDGTVDRALSKSYIVALPDAEKVKVGKDVRNIVENGEDKVWIEKDKGTFEYPYLTFVVIAQRK